MTASSLLTSCPHCQTQFRVSAEQLAVADGKVRCGHCMKVFNARDNQQSVEQPATGAPESPAPASEEFDREFSLDEELLFQDNPEIDASDDDYAGSASSFSDDELSDSFRELGEEPLSAGFRIEEEPEPESVDESWAEAMLLEDSAPLTPQPPPPVPQPRTPQKPGEPAPSPSGRPAEDAPPPP
ncbi:MJ0042-type zinc finger domain-containing protein [Marinobacter sp. X15-166B]|uniref:MJ0042-type zinc finger domain-containing protein n=1 Tax=Marinobacter sp. X15-166B TaxID=1897620 RepID=UPI001D17AB8D|nr:MJ0042-type zinc finger domain-containing protein [Marinobacter sp. X15-166B]